MATIRKRGDTWQAIVRRKKYSKSQTFRTKTDAANWATELEAKIYRNTAGLPESAKAYQFDELRHTSSLCGRLSSLYFQLV